MEHAELVTPSVMSKRFQRFSKATSGGASGSCWPKCRYAKYMPGLKVGPGHVQRQQIIEQHCLLLLQTDKTLLGAPMIPNPSCISKDLCKSMRAGLWLWPLDGHRFSAFWLRSKCSICSYQLNIWYEGEMLSSILNWFLKGDGMSGACSGPVKSWPCIAVPQGSAHFPTNLNNSDECMHLGIDQE